MRKINCFKFILVFVIIMLTISINSNAEKAKNVNNSSSSSTVLAPNASDCKVPVSVTYLSVNNVRFRINLAGDMWWDLASAPKYEIPKGSFKHSMYSGSLWIGGVDENGQNLRLAAIVHRKGNSENVDYYAGPITIDGTATADYKTCLKYDKHFRMTRSEVEKFIGTGEITENIKNYPGNGDVSKGQSLFLAPFNDVNDDFIYNPSDGDYPYYDIKKELCSDKGKVPTPEELYYQNMSSTNLVKIKGTSLADQVLKGDETVWWVFNDKGGVHKQSSGVPIGVEIRAQAFGFSTSDEINNMTFYSYEIINRSSISLYDTYFSQWVDTDLGDAEDDYVGCDVKRGLGYCYNGKAVDGTGKIEHYGENPPAVGVDYFQGPYMNPDGIDNPMWSYDTTVVGAGFTLDSSLVCDNNINGVNFGDGVPDNERLGMQRFVFHNNGGDPNASDPDVAQDFYNYLRGIWKNGQRMGFGGNGYKLENLCKINGNVVDANFMFPGTTDPCFWGTNGINTSTCPKPIWTEKNESNPYGDRRFMQSSGPFKLEPGAVNYITVGIPWARAANQGGDPYQSVILLQYVDDKAQLLFDNCFRVIDGPDAPILTAREFDREIVLYLDNIKGISNNYKNKPEDYEEDDYKIVTPPGQPIRDNKYRFEGYQIFQLKDETVSSGDLYDENKARLVAQCDVENYKPNGDPIGRLINYNYDSEVFSYNGKEMVNGSNKGIVHSFRIFEDKFPSGTDNKLTNHKKYYYMAIAYGYNEYLPYSQNPTIINGLEGQKQPYLSGRKGPTGPIAAITVIPHKTVGGIVYNSKMNDGPEIIKYEGRGNGGNIVDLTNETIDRILNNSSDKTLNYIKGKGPLKIKIVDPLKIKDGEFELRFKPTKNIDSSEWYVIDLKKNIKIADSDKNISVKSDQLFIDYGFAIEIQQAKFIADYKSIYDITTENAVFGNNVFLESSIEFADSLNKWLIGLKDFDDNLADSNSIRNWIRVGSADDPGSHDRYYTYYGVKKEKRFLDPTQQFERVIGGTWAPYRLTVVSEQKNYFCGPSFRTFKLENSTSPTGTSSTYLADQNLKNISSVDIVFTSDKTKWTRSAVIETGYQATSDAINTTYLRAPQHSLRRSNSVDKDGNEDGTGTGMGWFPGYAINVETGERLNIIFGEDSGLESENGRDMKWNPTSNDDLNKLGGKHYIIIMGHNGNTANECPAYDSCKWVASKLRVSGSLDAGTGRDVYKDAMWVNIPLLKKGQTLLSNDVKIRIRIAKPYGRYFTKPGDSLSNSVNSNYPYFKFIFKGVTATYSETVANEQLNLINVVPNPYYAYSSYELDQLDSRIKITNLPKKCTVKIYNLSGTLIREFSKDNETDFSIEWDLKNKAGIKVASGMYLIHINADGIGERIIKWYGVLRPVDLNAF